METLPKEELEDIIAAAKADADNPLRKGPVEFSSEDEIEPEHQCDDSCGCTQHKIPIVIARVLENKFRRLNNQAKRGGKKNKRRK